mgnify:CR=1 FL=1
MVPTIRNPRRSPGVDPLVPSVTELAVLSLHSSPLTQPGTGDSGGMNVYVRELAASLAQSGVGTTVYVRSWDDSLPHASCAVLSKPMSPPSRRDNRWQIARPRPDPARGPPAAKGSNSRWRKSEIGRAHV